MYPCVCTALRWSVGKYENKMMNIHAYIHIHPHTQYPSGPRGTIDSTILHGGQPHMHHPVTFASASEQSEHNKARGAVAGKRGTERKRERARARNYVRGKGRAREKSYPIVQLYLSLALSLLQSQQRS